MREIKCGLGELIKLAVLGDLDTFSQLELLAEDLQCFVIEPTFTKELFI